MRKLAIFLFLIFGSTAISVGTTLAADIYCVEGESLNTAIGCIPYSDPQKFIVWIMTWALGIGGGVAFLIMIGSGIKILTSSGNPDKIKDGKESFTSALSGLLLILFAGFILRIIGLEILVIPGF